MRAIFASDAADSNSASEGRHELRSLSFFSRVCAPNVSSASCRLRTFKSFRGFVGSIDAPSVPKATWVPFSGFRFVVSLRPVRSVGSVGSVRAWAPVMQNLELRILKQLVIVTQWGFKVALPYNTNTKHVIVKSHGFHFRQTY